MAESRTTTEKRRFVEREFQNIRELLELLMSEMSAGGQKVRTGPPFAWAPPTDVYETETEVIVIMDIAGMELRDIAVFTDGNVITIRGVRQEISPRCKKQFHKMEIQVGPFQRIIQVPVPIDLQSISQTYANGLLEVRMKKTYDQAAKRKVPVE